jgi:predicted dehydrogenase/threonine dehydrogenase-like Zn-dependent dehydrogenase
VPGHQPARPASRAQLICWPEPGRTQLAEIDEPTPADGEVAVRVTLSVTNTGTERARFTGAPNARIGFPHVPGGGAVGYAQTDGPGTRAGTFVAVRAGSHQSVIAARPDDLYPVPAGIQPVDAALWQTGVIAAHGLGLGRYADGEPVTVVGAGLIGTMTWRTAAALGSGECRILASSRAKERTAQACPASTAIEFLPAEQAAVTGNRHRLVLDATGTASGLAVAVAAAADGGRIVLLGSPRSPDGAVPVGELHDRGLSVVGAHIDTLPDAAAAAGRDLLASYTERYFRLLSDGLLTMADLASVYSPEQAPHLYQRLASDRSLIVAAVQWAPKLAPVSGPSRADAIREPTRPVGLAVVGCGDIGAQNAEAITRVDGTVLAGCFDTDPRLARDLASRFGTVHSARLDELLRRPEVGAVLVATPHDTHEELAMAVLASGKHLLLQKPLAADLPAGRRIAAAAARAEATASVLMPGRYEPGYRLARLALDQDWLGPPVGLVSAYLVDKPASYYRGGYTRRTDSSWRLSKARSGGGVLIMNLAHHLDIACSLLGAQADSVFAETSPSAHSPQIEDFATVTARFGQTVATFIGAASVPGSPGEQLRIWGPHGGCVVLPDGLLSRRAAPDETAWPGERAPAEPGVTSDPQVAAIAGFVDAIRRRRVPDVTIEDALAVQAMIAAAYQSAETGLRVRPADLLG